MKKVVLADRIYAYFLRLTRRLSTRQMLMVLAVVVGALAGLAVSFIPAFLINRSIAKSDKPEFRILKFLLR